jgi:Transposase DDE domain/Transposase domain (DUF772)
MHTIAGFWGRIQATLFSHLEQCLPEPITPKQRQLVAIFEIVRVEEALPPPARRGRPQCDRGAVARAFLAKAYYNLPTTELLVESLRAEPNLRRLCGFEHRNQVPSAATFSRAFAEFAHSGLADRVHQALIRQHVSGELIGHISRDSTEIEARERPQPVPPPTPRAPRRRGRPPRGQAAPPWPPTRLQRQLEQTPEAACAELAQGCGVGCKLDSQGHPHYWIGYKAHLDVTDDMLPISMLTTSARVHDSQVAIPLARLTSQRVTALYELMDKAYDAAPIYEAVEALGHVPLIARSGRTHHRPPLDPAQARRLHARSAVERVHARLKDEFGGRQLRVRGQARVHAHLMFGLLALFADQLLKLAT